MISVDDFINWSNDNHFNKIYYVINKWNVIRVPRNKSWFDSIKNTLKETHTLIMKLQNSKELFDQYLKNYLELKNKSFYDKYNNTEYLLSDDNLSLFDDQSEKDNDENENEMDLDFDLTDFTENSVN